MRIDEVYNNICDILRKPRNGAYPIFQFNRDAKKAQQDGFNNYFEGYSQTQKLHDALSPFKVKLPFTLATSGNGTVTMPADYAHLLAADAITFANDSGRHRTSLRVINEDELSSALASQVRPVRQYPVAVGNASTIQLYPEVAQAGELTYLRLPKDPVYAYTTNVRQPVYNPTGSQDIEFSDVYMPNIIARIVAYAAQFFDDQTTIQFAEMQQTKTA
jgi:hypothetical protein